jgi:type II secretory pathway component PulM
MKLAPYAIWILGACIALICLSFGFFWHWQPNSEESGLYSQRIEELEAEAAKYPQAQRRLREAQALAETEAAKWRQIVATRTPPQSVAEGGINLNVNPWQLAVDARSFRNNVQRAVNAQVRKGGVEVIQGPFVPGPDPAAPVNQLVSNYFGFGTNAPDFPVVVFNLGTITVQGTYDQIVENVEGWSRMPNYLAVTDALSITGTSPRMTGTYNLTVVGFIRGREIFPAVPEGSAQPGAGVGGGGRGGFGPGGPGGGFPGAGNIPFGPGGPGGPGGPPPGIGGPANNRPIPG